MSFNPISSCLVKVDDDVVHGQSNDTLNAGVNATFEVISSRMTYVCGAMRKKCAVEPADTLSK